MDYNKLVPSTSKGSKVTLLLYESNLPTTAYKQGKQNVMTFI
jgi:hypothetical protein